MDFLNAYRDIFEAQLSDFFEQADFKTEPLTRAVKYSIIGGGKRIRPILAYLGAEFVGGKPQDVEATALCVEMIHGYSLVHDDLPCMDNDTLRRGRPTTHVAFGEGMGVLTGDAMLNTAFEILLDDAVTHADVNSAAYVASCSGMRGMIAGQCIDISDNAKQNAADLLYLYDKKTSALFRAALVGAAIKCGANEAEIGALEYFADRLGEIFQIVDDILDVTSTDAVLGKNVKSDASQGKFTYVAIVGLEQAAIDVKILEEQAVSALRPYGERGAKLINLCRVLSNRSK